MHDSNDNKQKDVPEEQEKGKCPWCEEWLTGIERIIMLDRCDLLTLDSDGNEMVIKGDISDYGCEILRYNCSNCSVEIDIGNEDEAFEILQNNRNRRKS